MNSHNTTDETVDLSLSHTLKNWAAHREPPSNGRKKLLAAARQSVKTERRKPSRFSFGGWSFQFPNDLSEMSVRANCRRNLETIYALKSMAVM